MPRPSADPMNGDVKIAVLLATYNGAEYLVEQLDSILAQSWQNFVLVIRDDGSSDATKSLLESYAARHGEKVHLLEDVEPASGSAGEKGASANFSKLIDYVLGNKEKLGLETAYMLFSDQDDVWHLDKIAKQMQAMRTLESQQGATALPLLVHSDLRVVTESLEPIAESFVRYQGLDETRNNFAQMLISNLVTGCTLLINETLATHGAPVPADAIMHDWWLALVAAAFGKIAFIPEPLVEYRQHGSNTLGAKQHQPMTLKHRNLLKKVVHQPYTPLFVDVATQAKIFRSRFAGQLSFSQWLPLVMTRGLAVRVGHLQRILFRLLRAFA